MIVRFIFQRRVNQMSNDNTVRTYYPGLNSSKVISIDSYKHDAQFNPLYNSLEISNEELSRVAEIVSNNANQSFIQGDAFSMGENNYVTHRELDEKIKNLDDKNELRYNDLSHQIGSSKDLMISKIDSLSGKFDTIQKNMNDKFNNMKWTIGIIVTLFGIIISLIVKYR